MEKRKQYLLLSQEDTKKLAKKLAKVILSQHITQNYNLNIIFEKLICKKNPSKNPQNSKISKGLSILLTGDLGTGKTTFARFLIQELISENQEVLSPTFTLLQTYTLSDLLIWHFDLYRLKSPSEVFELGIEEAYAKGICLIEWPERLGNFMPKQFLKIDFQQKESQRFVAISFSSL